MARNVRADDGGPNSVPRTAAAPAEVSRAWTVPYGAPGAAAVGVIGGGTMGAGIAHVVVEASEEAAAAAEVRVEASLRAAEERGKLTCPIPEALSNIVFTADLAALGEVRFVIEAVPEDADLKRSVLSRVEFVVGTDTTIATNTSSLSIGSLATAVSLQRRFVGMLFFNPVPASKLVEIVRGPSTSDEAVERAADLAALIGRETITVRDSPGFATSRLGIIMGLEAIRMLEEGVADAADIDRGMVLGYRHPMGPLRLGDLVGLDVRLNISEYLAEELGERFAPPELLRKLVADGHLGKKTGRGFYEWK
jgi:3-hydroxybutyryl-CoA dehydrogenase